MAVGKNIPEIKDSSTEGCFDIGFMRIQWGVLTVYTSGSGTITFQKPFKNTGYSLNISEVATGPAFVISTRISTKETGLATVYQAYDTGGTGVVSSSNYPANWIAIGLKP